MDLLSLGAIATPGTHPWIQNLWLPKQTQASLSLLIDSLDCDVASDCITEPIGVGVMDPGKDSGRLCDLLDRCCDSILDLGCEDFTCLEHLLGNCLEMDLSPKLERSFHKVFTVAKLMHFPNLLLLAKVAEKYPDLIGGEVLNWVEECRGYEKWRLGQIQDYSVEFEPPLIVLQLCSRTPKLFSVAQSVLRGVEFTPKILELYRRLVDHIVQFSSEPLWLFPSNERGLVHYLLHLRSVEYIQQSQLRQFSMFDSDGNSVGDEDELAKENVRKLLIESDVKLIALSPLVALCPRVLDDAFLKSLESEEEESDED